MANRKRSLGRISNISLEKLTKTAIDSCRAYGPNSISTNICVGAVVSAASRYAKTGTFDTDWRGTRLKDCTTKRYEGWVGACNHGSSKLIRLVRRAEKKGR